MHHPVALTQKVGKNIDNLAKTISVAVDSIRCAWGRNVERRGFLCDHVIGCKGGVPCLPNVLWVYLGAVGLIVPRGVGPEYMRTYVL
jgi:hypothetical protein